MPVVKKVAFMVHEPTMFAHYSSVWAEMAPDSFVIVLTGVFSDSDEGKHGTSEFLTKVNSAGYTTVNLADIVAGNIKYEYVVSNHVLGGRSSKPASRFHLALRSIKNILKTSINIIYRVFGRDERYPISNLDPVQYLPLQAGLKQIRFMYGADVSDAWSLDTWNEIYDLFLCHGPNDEKHLKQRFKGKTAFMGYPRYDRYFSEDLNVEAVATEFAIDPHKSTILWMPTMDPFGDDVCSIPHFAEAIAGLSGPFNVIVRPHPVTFRVDPASIELLERLQFKIDSDATRDMNELFRIADVVLCDHGGSAFGAMYLGKKLVFLSTPHADDAVVTKNSSNLELMEHYPVLDSADIAGLGALIENAEYWQNCLEKGRTLSAKYFSDLRGESSKRAAEVLADLDRILA
jgi:hypothetical protein